MRIAGAEYSIRKKAYDVFISGCTRNCYNCFNKEVQSFDYGTLITKFTIDELIQKLILNRPIIDRLRIMGGDLLCNPPDESHSFIMTVKSKMPKGIKLVLYTGEDKDKIPSWCFKLFDEIKYGAYIEKFHCESDLYGSTNQHYIIKDEYERWNEIV